MRSHQPLHPRILLVEDDPFVAAALAEMLEEASFEVDGPYASLSDGAEAVAKRIPDGAVLDIRLQDRDVSLIADDLERYGVPFIFCSGLPPAGKIKELLADHPLVMKDHVRQKLVPALWSVLN